ncbi:MAG: IS110 family transposase [Calditrichaeota bacterium]|nr:MAG: IS110 family transposase [Calditrichota bacterium]
MKPTCLFVGIDVSKSKHDVAVIDQNKQLVAKPFVIADNRQGYQTLINKLNALRQNNGQCPVKIGLEATSDYWKNLYYFLCAQSDEFQLTVINPVQTHHWAKTQLRRAKTDPLDAKEIALFMAEKNPSPTVRRTPIFDIIKDIDQRLSVIRKQLTATLNRLRLELTKVAPELEKAIKKLDSKRILAVLIQLPTAEAMAQAPVETWRQIRYGKNNVRLPQTLIEKLKQCTTHSVAYKTGPGAGIAVQSLVREILFYQQEQQLLRQHMAKLYQQISDQESLLCSIPGIRRETAIALEAYIGDVHRFPNAKKIVAYFGLNPTIQQSGKSKRKARLQKKGNPIVRHKLFMAVISIIRQKKGPIYRYYQRLVDSGKPKLTAIGAAMRKLLVTIYSMLKNKQPFDENKM